MAAAAAMASSAARSRQREDGCLHIHREKRTGEKRVEGGEGGGGREERQSRGVLHVSLQRGVDPK